GPQDDEPMSGLVFDDAIYLTDYEPAKLRALRDELSALPPTIRAPEGHTLTADSRGRVLVRVVETPTTSNYYYVADGFMLMPRPLLDITFRNGLVLSTLWKRATPDLDRLSPEIAQRLMRA